VDTPYGYNSLGNQPQASTPYHTSFNGQRLAMRKGGSLYYLHAAPLGSSVLTTRSADATEQFRAYGAVRGYSGSNPSRYQFTSQYIDSTGLYYDNAGYDDPQLGQFIALCPYGARLVLDLANLPTQLSRRMSARRRCAILNQQVNHPAQEGKR
jgi:hypothetical protein